MVLPLNLSRNILNQAISRWKVSVTRILWSLGEVLNKANIRLTKSVDGRTQRWMYSNFPNRDCSCRLVAVILWAQFLQRLFIALIHPIQWTIANPVGADRPAKRQKKTSCVATGWPVRSTVHSPDGASYFLPV